MRYLKYYESHLLNYDIGKYGSENVEGILLEKSAAITLRDAVRGPGTNPTLLRNAINKLNSKAEYDELNKTIRENPNYFLVGGGAKNLQDILNQELDNDNTSTAEYIQKKLSSIGVNMKFNTFDSKDYSGNINKMLYTDSITIDDDPSGGQAGGGQAGGGQAGGGQAGGGQSGGGKAGGGQSGGSGSTICSKALGANEGPKIEEFKLTFPGDSGYKYVFKEDKWYALNIKTQKRFGLTDLINGGCTKYQVSVDRLNKQFPNTSQEQKQVNTSGQSGSAGSSGSSGTSGQSGSAGSSGSSGK